MRTHNHEVDLAGEGLVATVHPRPVYAVKNGVTGIETRIEGGKGLPESRRDTGFL